MGKILITIPEDLDTYVEKFQKENNIKYKEDAVVIILRNGVK